MLIDLDLTIVVTDRDNGLINAWMSVFPRAARLLCIWHINTNVLADRKPKFTTSVSMFLEYQDKKLFKVVDFAVSKYLNHSGICLLMRGSQYYLLLPHIHLR